MSQDTAVSWGHRILRTPPRVLGHGVPRIRYRPLSWGYPGILRMPPVSHDANLRFQSDAGRRFRFRESGSPIPRCHGSVSLSSNSIQKKQTFAPSLPLTSQQARRPRPAVSSLGLVLYSYGMPAREA